MISHFVNREKELELLEREWKNVPSMIVIYGRRRVGKTRLLVEFSRGKRVFFHTFMEGSKEEQIRNLREELAVFFNDDLFLSFSEWNPLLKYLAARIKEKTLVVFDEFTYAIKSDRTVLSALQRVWDHELSEKPIVLVLSGSLIGMMVDEVLSSASPLYGRRTLGFRLRPLSLFSSLKFFKNFELGIGSYMLVGGIPPYLAVASRYSNLGEFVEENFLRAEGYFYDEPYILLSGELRELKTYFSLLRAIARGRTRPSEIAGDIGIETRRLYPYLDTLIRLGIIERELPVAGKDRRGLYRLKDPMLLTWFSLVPKNRTAIELGVINFEDVKNEVQKVLSVRFEEVAREFMVELNKADKLPFRFTRIGRWWHRGEEIDLVALNERERKALFIEVKWKVLSEREARGILKDLKRKSRLVRLDGWDKIHGVVAKHIKGKENLRVEGWSAWDLKDFRDIGGWLHAKRARS